MFLILGSGKVDGGEDERQRGSENVSGALP